MGDSDHGSTKRFAIRVDPAFRGLFAPLDAGARHDVVELDLEPRQRAWLLCIWPPMVHVLYVSLEDPDGFVAAIGSEVTWVEAVAPCGPLPSSAP